MGTLNIRNVDGTFVTRLKQAALGRGMSLRSYCLEMLEGSLPRKITKYTPVSEMESLLPIPAIVSNPSRMDGLMEEMPDDPTIPDVKFNRAAMERFVESIPRMVEEARTISHLCIECGLLMRNVKGKWGCADTRCSMYGLEQKVRGV